MRFGGENICNARETYQTLSNTLHALMLRIDIIPHQLERYDHYRRFLWMTVAVTVPQIN